MKQQGDDWVLTEQELLDTKQQSFTEGRSHNKYASEETKKLFKSMEDKLDKIIGQLNDMKIEIKTLPSCIFKEADGKYASKKVEKVMWAMFGAVGLALLASAMKLILI
jgi:uncharacterized protein (DUF885 family)